MTPSLHITLVVGPWRPLSDAELAQLHADYFEHKGWLLAPERNRPGERPWAQRAFDDQDSDALDRL